MTSLEVTSLKHWNYFCLRILIMVYWSCTLNKIKLVFDAQNKIFGLTLLHLLWLVGLALKTTGLSLALNATCWSKIISYENAGLGTIFGIIMLLILWSKQTCRQRFVLSEGFCCFVILSLLKHFLSSLILMICCADAADQWGLLCLQQLLMVGLIVPYRRQFTALFRSSVIMAAAIICNIY